MLVFLNSVFLVICLLLFVSLCSSFVVFVLLLLIGGAIKGVAAQVYGVLQASDGEPTTCGQGCPSSGMM